MSNIASDNMINITIDQEESLDMQSIRKMAFIYNALDEGWQVIKKTDRYIFTKKHEGRKEVLSDDYLKKFIVKNFSLDKLIE